MKSFGSFKAFRLDAQHKATLGGYRPTSWDQTLQGYPATISFFRADGVDGRVSSRADRLCSTGLL